MGIGAASRFYLLVSQAVAEWFQKVVVRLAVMSP